MTRSESSSGPQILFIRNHLRRLTSHLSNNSASSSPSYALGSGPFGGFDWLCSTSWPTCLFIKLRYFSCIALRCFVGRGVPLPLYESSSNVDARTYGVLYASV